MTGTSIFNSNIRRVWLGFALVALVTLQPSTVLANTSYIRDDGKNRWPGLMVFHAPCGVSLVSTGDITYMAPPPVIDFSTANSPANLCASLMRTLTDADATSVTTIGAFNPQYQKMPDGSAVPPIAGLSTAQDPQNIPTPYVELSTSGTMQFIIPINFRDDTDTMFEGKFEALLESPYDAFYCPTLPGAVIDPNTGLAQPTAVPTLCQITAPAQYLHAIKVGHKIGWTEVSSASVMAYGPTDTVPAGTQPWQKQAPGTLVAGAIALPYQTENNSTVLRIALRYGMGFDGNTPLTWGGWPTPYCKSTNCLQPSDWAGMQTPWMPSQPFTVQIQPVYQVQFHVLPDFILYQPAGNQSTSSISTNLTYTQNYQSDQTSTITDQNEYDNKTKTDLSFDPGFNVNGFTGSASFSQSTTWDNSSKIATKDQYALSVSSVVSQGQTSTWNTAKLDGSAPDYSHLTFQTEPFWSDQIFFAVNPQFAVWDYPKGQKLQPLGSSQLKAFSVAQLAGCVPRMWAELPTPLEFTYDILNPDNTTTHKQDSLSPFECASLLALDPFYVGLSQAAAPAVGISVSSQSLTNGVHTDQSNQVNSFTTKGTYTKTYDATVTAAEQNTNTTGITDGILGSKLSASVSYTNGYSNANQVTIALGTTQSSTTQQTLTSTINLADCPLVSGKSSCDAPLANAPNVQVFEDTRFGTMMSVLPDLSIPAPSTGPGISLGHITISATVINHYQSLGITQQHANLNLSGVQVNRPATVIHTAVPVVHTASAAPAVTVLGGKAPVVPMPGVKAASTSFPGLPGEKPATASYPGLPGAKPATGSFPGLPTTTTQAAAPAPAPLSGNAPKATGPAAPIPVGHGQASALSAPDQSKISTKYPALKTMGNARENGSVFAKITKLEKGPNGKLIAVTGGAVGLGTKPPQLGGKPLGGNERPR